jgi:hypothetical protein
MAAFSFASVLKKRFLQCSSAASAGVAAGKGALAPGPTLARRGDG